MDKNNCQSLSFPFPKITPMGMVRFDAELHGSPRLRFILQRSFTNRSLPVHSQGSDKQTFQQADKNFFLLLYLTQPLAGPESPHPDQPTDLGSSF